MNDNQILQLETSIAKIKADLTVVDRALEALKEKNGRLSKQIDNSEDTMSALNNDVYKMSVDYNSRFSDLKKEVDRLGEEMNDVNNTLSRINKSITSIDNKLETVNSTLSSNAVISFTSEFNFKKLIIIIATIMSFISSPGLLAAAWKEVIPSEADKIDVIIELLENQSTNENPASN